MKKLILVTSLLALLLGSMVPVQAEIIPARGEGQIGLSSVVLCESLTLYRDRDTDSDVVKTLRYGDRVIVMNQSGSWANCVLGDSEDSPAGWVKSDYLAIDPSWYRTDDVTTVYAWDDTRANKVALLSKGTELPILKDDGDWYVVSLRGASGWIQK